MKYLGLFITEAAYVTWFNAACLTMALGWVGV
jgi:hypothetical protein